MFLVYKPKGGRVKATKITLETLEEAVAFFRGRITREPVTVGREGGEPLPSGHILPDSDNLGPITGFEYPTFVGLVAVKLGDYMVGDDVGGYKKVEGKDFEASYEPARVVTRETKS